LQNNGEDILGKIELIAHVIDFYRNLFGPSPISSLRLDVIVCNQITEEDRLELIKPFDLEEIKRWCSTLNIITLLGLMGS
jgi:hypothetical protein